LDRLNRLGIAKAILDKGASRLQEADALIDQFFHSQNIDAFVGAAKAN